MEYSFYIPINSGSLAHYFNKAIILPAKYFKNKPYDIQNRFADSLMLSESKWVINSDCSIEVVLTDKEIKELSKISTHFYLYNTPIPISRVKSVCFLDIKQKETTVWNINSGAAFIPESIVTVEKSKDVEIVSDKEINVSNEFISTSELLDKIKRFDIILGGFAFMRLGGKSFMNYSENYFSTLSYFNKLIEEQTLSAAKEKGLKFSGKYTGLFSEHESEWSKWKKHIYNNIDSKDIQALAEKEGIIVEIKLGILQINSINPNSHLYELAILATYGDRKNKSTDNLVTDLTNGTIIQEKIEDVSILFGLNSGYSKLRNKYKSQEKSSIVKFNLESKLDYYIIESVYQFVFNDTKASYSFNYIDNWCSSNKFKDNLNDYETYKILDTFIIVKKKQSILERFLGNYSAEIFSAIIKIINEWLPPYAKTDTKEAIQYFENHLSDVLTASIKAFQKEIKNEFEVNYNSQKQDVIESYKQKIDDLLLENSNLKEEIAKLKKESNSLLSNERSIKQMPKAYYPERDVAEENGNQVSMVQKQYVKEDYNKYSTLNITDLKKIAKQKRVSGTILNGFKKENKTELIALIIKIDEQDKFL